MKFQVYVPTKIIVEKGCSDHLGTYIKEEQLQNVLIITDQGIRKSGILKRIYDDLTKEQVKYHEIYDVQPNPRDVDCERIADLYANKHIEGVIAIGGGSVIDTAKMVSILLVNGGRVKDYEGLNIAKTTPLPIICIPTTAGTGSEVTSWSIITDTKDHYKIGVGDDRIIPKIALLDVKLTETLPWQIAASTGMDALTHAIEAYTCNIANPITDGMALHSIKLIHENLIDAIQNPDDESARESMLVASLMAGVAFGNADTAAVHCISEAIGGKYDTPHGIANSIFLPYVFEYNMTANMKRHGEVGYALGVSRNMSYEDAAKETLKILLNLSSQLHIPLFSEIDHVNPDDFEQLSVNSVKSFSNPHNARKMNESDYLKILEEAYEGKLNH